MECFWEIKRTMSLETFRPDMLQKQLDSCLMAISNRQLLTFGRFIFRGCKITSFLKIATAIFLCPDLFLVFFFTNVPVDWRVVVSVSREACLHQPQAGKNFLQVAWEQKNRYQSLTEMVGSATKKTNISLPKWYGFDGKNSSLTGVWSNMNFLWQKASFSDRMLNDIT